MNRLPLLLTIDLSAPNLEYISAISTSVNSDASISLVQEIYHIIFEYQSTTIRSASHAFCLQINDRRSVMKFIDMFCHD